MKPHFTLGKLEINTPEIKGGYETLTPEINGNTLSVPLTNADTLYVEQHTDYHLQLYQKQLIAKTNCKIANSTLKEISLYDDQIHYQFSTEIDNKTALELFQWVAKRDSDLNEILGEDSGLVQMIVRNTQTFTPESTYEARMKRMEDQFGIYKANSKYEQRFLN